MPRIQNPEVARALARRFDIQGPEIDTLAPELVGVVDIDALITSQILERSAVGAVTAAAVAAQFSTCRVTNRPGSSLVLELVRAIITAGALTTVRIFSRTGVTATLPTVGTVAFRDQRVPGNPSAIVASSTLVAVSGAQGEFDFPLQPNVPTLVPLPYSLIPGGELEVQCSNANIRLDVGFQWIERDQLETD